METPQLPSGGPQPPTSAQVIAPLTQAWDHMKAQLFPFNFSRWFTLGFVTWLAMLGPQGCRMSLPPMPGQRPWSPAPNEIQSKVDNALHFADAHMTLVVVCGVAALILLLCLFVATAYLQSRGLFMYMDCIVRRRAAVKEPWRRTREQAWQLFLLRLVIGLVLYVALLADGAALLMALLPSIRNHSLGWEQALPIMLALLVLMPFLLGWALVQYVASELLAPIMYLRGMSLRQAWQELRRIARGNLWTITLFGLMQVVIAMACGMLTVPVICCTCFIGALPVINQTILQPLYLWTRLSAVLPGAVRAGVCHAALAGTGAHGAGPRGNTRGRLHALRAGTPNSQRREGALRLHPMRSAV